MRLVLCKTSIQKTMALTIKYISLSILFFLKNDGKLKKSCALYTEDYGINNLVM